MGTLLSFHSNANINTFGSYLLQGGHMSSTGPKNRGKLMDLDDGCIPQSTYGWAVGLPPPVTLKSSDAPYLYESHRQRERESDLDPWLYVQSAM